MLRGKSGADGVPGRLVGDLGSKGHGARRKKRPRAEEARQIVMEEGNY